MHGGMMNMNMYGTSSINNNNDLILRPNCERCGKADNLYGSECKHLTLCLECGKAMAERRDMCRCGTIVSKLLREYNVRGCSGSDKNYFIGKFVSGLPSFSPKKKSAENKWSLQKEGLQGRQITDALREKYKNKPWVLEDETGQSEYHGVLEGAQSATYCLLMIQGREIIAIPAGSWYTFSKVRNYKTLTLEEAEEKMKNRKKTADGYERWMMKVAHNGPAAFGEVDRSDEKESVGTGGGRGRKKSAAGDDEANVSDGGEEGEDDEFPRKTRQNLKKTGADDDEEGPRGGDLDLDDEDVEKGDDWEHEEIFTDDDEAVGNDPEEREDLGPDIPAPPEIKQDEDDEDEEDEEEGGLSKSGKELKKLLGRTNGLNDSDQEDDDDDDDIEDESSPVLAPKKKDPPKEEPVDNSPAKVGASGSARGTPPANKSSKSKRKMNGDDAKATSGSVAKKVKTENDVKLIKEEPASTSKSAGSNKGVSPSKAGPSPSSGSSSGSSSGPVTEDEIKTVLLQKAPVTTTDLVSHFKSRLRNKEDKDAFAAILRKISKIQKTSAGSYVVLRTK